MSMLERPEIRWLAAEDKIFAFFGIDGLSEGLELKKKTLGQC